MKQQHRKMAPVQKEREADWMLQKVIMRRFITTSPYNTPSVACLQPTTESRAAHEHCSSDSCCCNSCACVPGIVAVPVLHKKESVVENGALVHGMSPLADCHRASTLAVVLSGTLCCCDM